MTALQGQSTLEYLLALVAIILAILFAAKDKGPIQSAVGNIMSSVSQTLQQGVNDTANRFSF